MGCVLMLIVATTGFRCRCKVSKLLAGFDFRLPQLADEQRDCGAGAVQALADLRPRPGTGVHFCSERITASAVSSPLRWAPPQVAQ